MYYMLSENIALSNYITGLVSYLPLIIVQPSLYHVLFQYVRGCGNKGFIMIIITVYWKASWWEYGCSLVGLEMRCLSDRVIFCMYYMKVM
jgi:hypothetical protein